MRRLLAILVRLVGTALLVAAVAGAAYGIGHATRKRPANLARALAAASGPQAPGAHPAKASTPSKRRRAAHRTGKVDRGRVVVAVLNASSTPGLARGASDRLAAAGFARGTVTNAASTRTATRVFYGTGKRDGAADVAKVLGVGRGAIRSIDAATRTLAGPEAAVVVRLGSDRSGSSGG